MNSEDVMSARKAHHAALETLALTVNCKTPGLKLWRKLCQIERVVHAACEDYSNDSNFGLERWELVKTQTRQQLRDLFGGTIPKGVYLNGDPRGHTLKLDCDEVIIPAGMDRDWGGNGILAAIID